MLLTLCVTGSVLGALKLDADKWRAIAECIRGGIKDRDLAVTKAAQLWMDMDPAQFERGLNGEASLDLRRLANLPDEVWPHVALRILEKFGFPEQVKTALKVEALRKDRDDSV